MIRGWALYHRHNLSRHCGIVAKQTFNYVDSQIWQMLWKWSRRRHAHKKSVMWVKKRYFMLHQGQDWTFFGKHKDGDISTIFKASRILIRRHVKIKSTSNPYDKEEELYFESRNDDFMLNKLTGKHMMRYLYERQSGCCPICHQKITLQTGYNTHHLHPKHLGGKWSAYNLVLVHPVCHVQIHQNSSVAAALNKSV
jgi:RNA-directed DNA polymerase